MIPALIAMSITYRESKTQELFFEIRLKKRRFFDTRTSEIPKQLFRGKRSKDQRVIKAVWEENGGNRGLFQETEVLRIFPEEGKIAVLLAKRATPNDPSSASTGRRKGWVGLRWKELVIFQGNHRGWKVSTLKEGWTTFL